MVYNKHSKGHITNQRRGMLLSFTTKRTLENFWFQEEEETIVFFERWGILLSFTTKRALEKYWFQEEKTNVFSQREKYLYGKKFVQGLLLKRKKMGCSVENFDEKG